MYLKQKKMTELQGKIDKSSNFFSVMMQTKKMRKDTDPDNIINKADLVNIIETPEA